MDSYCDSRKNRPMALTLVAWRKAVRERLAQNKEAGRQPDSQAKLAKAMELNDASILNKMLQGTRAISATEISAIAQILGDPQLAVVDGYEKSTGNPPENKEDIAPSTVTELLQQAVVGDPMKALDRMGLRDLLTRYPIEQIVIEAAAILAEQRAKRP